MITREQSREFIAARVNELLDREGKSRYWLARQLDVSDVRIKNLCDGTHEPCFSFVVNLAAVFDVPVSHFSES